MEKLGKLYSKREHFYCAPLRECNQQVCGHLYLCDHGNANTLLSVRRTMKIKLWLHSFIVLVLSVAAFTQTSTGAGVWTGAGSLVYISGGSTVAPSVTTTTATSITDTTASAGGVVTANGGASVTSEGTCYGTSANPTSPCTSDGTATPFTSSISGLTQSTLYHYRAFATNSAGTGYGSDQN